MNTQLEWLIQQRVLVATRSGKESLAEIKEFTRQVLERLEEEGVSPVHLIWDMSGLDVDGVDRKAVMTFLNQLMKHEKVKWFVVVDSEMSFFRRFLTEALLRLGGIHWRTVDSQTAGLAFLRKSDSSLPG
jgi:hypothetical protein